MKVFRNGVSYYTTLRGQVTAHFPEDEVICFHCRWRYVDRERRQMCRLMERELYAPEYMIHEDCPLTESFTISRKREKERDT